MSFTQTIGGTRVVIDDPMTVRARTARASGAAIAALKDEMPTTPAPPAP